MNSVDGGHARWQGFCLGLGFSMALCAPAAPGQVMLSPAFEKPSEQADNTADSAAAKRGFTLAPQAPPDPMLRYRLWPAPEDRRQRAAMVAVNRSLLLVARVHPTSKRRFLESFDQWLSLPIDQLPVAEARASYEPFDSAISVLKTGENWMDLRYDLGLNEMTTSEKVATLLPEYQEMRDLARLLCLRARVAAAEHRWQDAVAELRLGFRLSEVCGHSTDTLLSRLIGVAISEVVLDTIESMVQMPDCPNLYWALAGLPVEHLFELREAIEYESTLSDHVGTVAGFGKLPDEIIGEDKSLARIKEIVKAFSNVFQSNDQSDAESSWMQMSTGMQVTMMVQPSRILLSKDPDWKDRVDELSDAEAVLRASDFELARIRDSWLAWALLPSEYWHDYQPQLDAAMEVPAATKTLGGKLARIMLPAIGRASAIGRQCKQQHHRLVTLEALRMHAAETGELPPKLNKLRPVPAWLDPITQKPFQYVRTSKRDATLSRAEGARDKDDIQLDIQLQVKP